ncbi:MAG: UDP-N-acetylmuramate dehydrogenase [Blautia sp.]
MKKEIREKFCELLGKDKVLFEEPMSSHTTFRIGGPAEVFLMPESYEQIRSALALCREEGVPYFVLGNGSNLLVSDSGYRGVIIQMDRNMGDIELKGTEIRACAGALLSSVAAAARKASLTGFEFAGGIPGTLGGAVVMNAGAYGGEMKDVLREVTVMTKEGDIRVIPSDRLELGYRTSIIKKTGYLVLEAVISLEKGDPQAIQEKTKELASKRTEKQPLDYPSAGSTFKRPEGYFAGKLIMDSGLRGFRVGGAQVSEKHCGFVINTGGATAKDVKELMDHVIRTVKENYNITLEPEVKFLGEF